jgi:diguanylate cyclase (GGDEF)-like protein
MLQAISVPVRKDQTSKTDRHTVGELTRKAESAFKPRLIVVSGMLLGQQMELGNAPVIVGRASQCALSMPHPSVSRQHCRIWREGDRYLIEDLGSTNHTYVNGKAVTRAELRDGDQISVGNNAIKFFTGTSLEANYHEELIDLAIYDSLTGFYNRRRFRALLDEEMVGAKSSTPLSLLLMDLDYFKQINDRHGHLVGDQVLSAVAKTIHEHAPADAPIGRLGGEEFALVLRGGSLQDAAALAEDLRAVVSAHPVETRDERLAVTISIGVAQSGVDGATASELLRRADERMYRAKQDGRNRVCSG